MDHTENKGLKSMISDGTDLNITAVAGFLIFLFVSGVLVNLVLYGMYRGLDAWEEKQAAAPHPMAQHQLSGSAPSKSMGITQAEDNKRVIERIQGTYSVKDGPRLQVDDERDLNEMHRMEEPKLTEYMWVNKQQGVVQIPVDQAMKVIVQRGLPNVPSLKPAAVAAKK